ncbi:hypothetical protein JZU68_06695, partial [bacterium]|nr:hypothetical protein [bacterium]
TNAKFGSKSHKLVSNQSILLIIRHLNLQGIHLKETAKAYLIDLSAISQGAYILRLDKLNYKIIME